MICSVDLSKPAEESLAYVLHQDKELGMRILGQLKHRLPYDPYPDIDDEQDIFHSEIVTSLQKERIDVHRLKSREFSNHRVFYIVDDDEHKIYVLEIVQRTAKTYDISTPHMERIKGLYIRYYVTKQMKGGRQWVL